MELTGHQIVKQFSKDNIWYLGCECGRGFKHRYLSSARWGWEAHTHEEWHKVAEDEAPLLLAVHKKARVTHKYWLYTVPAMNNLEWGGRKPTWFEQEYPRYKWAKYGIVREQQNGLRLLQIFADEELAKVWMYSTVRELKRVGEKVEMLGKLDIPDGATVPAKTLDMYVSELIDECKTTSPTKVKALTEEIEKLEGYLPLLVEAKNQMIRRMFT